MSDVAELSVIIKGKEVGLKSLLAAIERGLKQTDQAANKTSTELGKLATAEKRAADEALRDAQALARLDAAHGNTADGAARLRAALDANDGASLRLRASVEAQAVKMEEAATKTTRLQGELTSLAASYVSVGAVIAGAGALIGSFNEAISFKGQLDATNGSIRAQIATFRDANRVYAEGQAFANRYKLTQAELTASLQSSIGVMRQSNASTTEILTTFARLQQTAPEKSISEAARAIRELQSGDVTSIRELFNVPAADANRMKAEIQGGADAIAVVSQYLTDINIGAGALEASLQGVSGQMKDIALAQEQVKLAQAELAASAGAAGIFDVQIAATKGLARVLRGELLPSLDEVIIKARVYEEAFRGAALSGADPFTAQLAGLTALANGATVTAEAAQYYAESAEKGTTGGQQWGAANQEAAAGANAVTAATTPLITQLAEEAEKKQAAADRATELAALQRDLASIGGQVAAGLITSGQGADILRAKYGGAADEAERLLALQAQIAGAEARIAAGKARLAGQAAQTRDLVPGGIGFNAPGRGTGTDADIIAQVNRTAAEVQRTEAKAEADRLKIKKTGGRARVSEEQKTAAKLEDLERDHQAKLADIAADGAKKRLEAENALKLAQLRGRAGFYASLASIDDNALRQDLSARYEAAAQEAGRIAQEQGADAAQAYLEASQKAIEGEAQLRQDIAAAEKEGDTNKAEYLKGLLSLQQAADAEELRQIQEQGSAVANELKARYSAEEQAYREHLDQMARDAAARGVTLAATLPGPPATGTPATRPSAPAGSGATTTSSPETGGKTATVVSDPATQGAVEVSGGRLEGAINAVRDAIGAVERRVGDVEGAVRSLKSSGIKG